MDYKITEPKEVTQNRYEGMLDILPPSRWYRGHFMEYFHMSERLSGDLVTWFVRLGRQYWEFDDSCRLTDAQISEKMKAHISKEKALL